MKTNPTEIILTSPLTLAAGKDAAALPQQFSGIAYSGAMVQNWGALVVDLATTRFDTPMPLLAEHGRAEIIGVIDAGTNDGASLVVSGKIFSDIAGSRGEQIAQCAIRGAPYEMSIGLFGYNELWVAAGSSLMVNGQLFNGPLTVLQNGRVREVSIVSLGADANTDAQLFSAPANFQPPSNQGNSMDLQQLTARVAELTAQLATATAATQSAVDAAVLAERQRIMAVEGQLIPGHEALILSLKFDGKSTGGDAAQAVLAAERTARGLHAKNLAADAPNPLNLAAPANKQEADGKQLTRAEIHAKAQLHMKANPGVRYIDAVKTIQEGA
jgi:hypothetical protein